MMKKMIIVLLVIFSTSLFAMQSDDVKSSMDAKIHKALQILKNKQEATEEKAKKIFKIFDEMFDYNLMARLSLGKREWMNIDNNQRKKYVDNFIKLLKESFIEKLKLYNDQKIKIEDFLKTRSSRAILKTFIIDKKDKTEVDYKFYRSKKRGWIIYDVIVAGVSIIQSYRKQFADILHNGNFEEFLKSMKKSTADNNA
jgi:phospholipid transport system substrate-binding protein